MDVFDLVAKISIDSSGYEEGLKDAGQKTKSFGSSLSSGLQTAAKVGAAALTAVTGASVALGKSLLNNVNEFADQGDAIDKNSQKMGISAQAYQEWDAILQHSGSSIDSMSRGMQTLQKNAVNSADKFEKLGITQEQLANMSTEELFAKTIEGLQKMGEGAERTALASDLLGGSAKELGALLNTSAEETEQMRKRVHELGGVMSNEAVKNAAKFKDNLQDLKTAISGIKKGITSEFLPAVSDMMDGFTKLITGEEGAEEALDKGLDELGKAFDNILPKIENILDKLLPRLIEVIGMIITKLVEYLPKFIQILAKEIPGLIKSLVDTIAKCAPDLVRAGVELIVSLAEGLIDAIPDLVAAVPDIIIALVDALLSPEMIDRIINAGLSLVEKLFEGIISGDFINNAIKIIGKLVSALVGAAGQLLDTGLQLIGKVFEGIFSGDFGKKAWELIQKIGDAIVGVAANLIGVGAEIINKIFEGMKGAWETVKSWFHQSVSSLKNGVDDAFSKYGTLANINVSGRGGTLTVDRTTDASLGSSNYASSDHHANQYRTAQKNAESIAVSNHYAEIARNTSTSVTVNIGGQTISRTVSNGQTTRNNDSGGR